MKSPVTGLGPRLAGLTPRSRVYVQSTVGLTEPRPGRGRRIWLVARSLCRFFKVPLLPGANRACQIEALSLEVRRLSPFHDTGFHYSLADDFAAVWVWDEEETRAAAQAVGIDLAKIRVLPEPALYPPLEEGVRLVEAVDGFEGQIWAAGQLVASRWWASPPEERSWVAFQRGGSVPPQQFSASIPPPHRLERLNQAWTGARVAPFSLARLARLDMRLVAAAMVGAIAIGFSYETARYWRGGSDLAALRAEVAERSAAIDPILGARTRALENLTAIRLLHQLDAFPSQLAMMARVAKALPRPDVHFTEWLFDRGQLELGIAADQPLDIVGLVRSLESIEFFKTVAAERTGSNNSLRLRLTVAPL